MDIPTFVRKFSERVTISGNQQRLLERTLNKICEKDYLSVNTLQPAKKMKEGEKHDLKTKMYYLVECISKKIGLKRIPWKRFQILWGVENLKSGTGASGKNASKVPNPFKSEIEKILEKVS